MRFRHLLPLSAIAALVGVSAPAEAQISATDIFKFRVGTTAPTTSYWSAGHGDIDIHGRSTTTSMTKRARIRRPAVAHPLFPVRQARTAGSGKRLT